MPCPYAEVLGGVIRCRVKGDHVNPFVYPCLGDYRKCPRFTGAEAVKHKVVSAPRLREAFSEANFDVGISESISDVLYLSRVYTSYELKEIREGLAEDVMRFVGELVGRGGFRDILVSIKTPQGVDIAVRFEPDGRCGAAVVGAGVEPIRSFSRLMELLGRGSIRASIYISL